MNSNHRLLLALLVLLGTIYFAAGTKTRKCDGSKDFAENPFVSILNCTKLPCKLKRKTTVHVEMTVTPTMNHKDVRNAVFANIVGIPFPFIGVDGKSVCGKFTEVESGEAAPCPLQAGRTYVYRDGFKVLQIYPRLKTIVHWAIKAGNETLQCFEVPVRIT